MTANEITKRLETINTMLAHPNQHSAHQLKVLRKARTNLSSKLSEMTRPKPKHHPKVSSFQTRLSL